jgi:phospholipase/lecithinase/hemolysin
MKIQNNPTNFGLVNITAPCLENWEVFMEGVGGQSPQVCQAPDEYFYWDGQGHPTAKVHALLASEIREFLKWK